MLIDDASVTETTSDVAVTAHTVRSSAGSASQLAVTGERRSS